jgi:tetratricopeptide (TPR) repeat protein
MTIARLAFISYSTRDTTAAEAVCDGLEESGISCWIAPRDVAPGTSWAAAIDKAIDTCRLMVLVFSSHSNSSPQVVREVCNAVSNQIPIIPFRIENILPSGAMNYFLSTVHWFDAITPPLEDHISRLIDNANRLLVEKTEIESPAVSRVVLPMWTNSDVSLIGRASELEKLEDIWTKAHGGIAQAALITGAAGSGKTRLVQDFVTLQAGAGARWITSRTTAGDLSLPYAALEQAIRPVVEQGNIPDLPPEELAEVANFLPAISRYRPGLPKPRELEPEQARVWRQRAWANYLVAMARQTPLILHLDDLQWTDPTSLDCVRYLLMQHPHEPIFLIASLRTEGEKLEGQIREFRTNLRRSGVLTEIFLEPLSEEQTHELLRTMSGMTTLPRFSRRLHEHTEGNPLYLLEMIQMLFSQGALFKDEYGEWATLYDDFTKDYSELPLPDGVSYLMEPKLEGISDQAQEFIEVASVIGWEFDPFMVQKICELDRSQLRVAIDELTTRGLIRADRRRCEFAHRLLRETVYQDISFLDCPGWHEKVGQELAQSVGDSPSPTEIQQLAHHFYMAEDWDAAYRYQLSAGLDAWSNFDAHTARRYLETAYEIAENRLGYDLPEQQKLNCLKGLGGVYGNLGPHEQALSYYKDALSLVEGLPTQTADLCWRIAVVYERQPQHEKAIEWLDRGLAAVEKQEDPTEQNSIILSRLYMQHGLISFKQGRLQEGFDFANKALVADSAQAHNLLAVLHRNRGELQIALDHCDQSIQLSQAAGDLINLSKGYTNQGVILMDMDRWAEAVEAYEAALELLIDTGDAYVHAMTLGNLADVLRQLGELDTAYGYAKTALEESTALESDFDIALAQLNLGEILIDQGEPHRARVEHLEIALEHLLRHDIKDLLPQAERDIAEAFLEEKMLEKAEKMAESALSSAREQESSADVGIAQRILGQIHIRQDRGSQGEELIRQSIDTLEENAPRYEVAHSYMALGGALATDTSRLDESKNALEKAQAIFEELGARLDLERARALLAKLTYANTSEIEEGAE